MTLRELLDRLEKIRQERTLEAHHDDILFSTYPDVEALERVIALVKFLADRKPSDEVTVARLLKAAQIGK